jgi:acyl-coenzyme A thioesterase PaaI-like protein
VATTSASGTPGPPGTEAGDRRDAVEELGSAVRELVHAVVDTEADEDVLLRAGELAREAAALLSTRVRPENRLAAVDLPRSGSRTYSPVTGRGNPVSPPARIVLLDPEQLRVEAECMLHRTHEGPPTYGHGGMSAMLLDQILGTAAAVVGRMGMTRTLSVTYRRPVPLGRPLRLTARVIEADGTRILTEGEIAAADRPDVALVRATATFVIPRPDQVERLFGHVQRAGEEIPAGD